MHILFLFTLIVYVVAQVEINCDPSETELFYENAEDLTEWTFDSDNSSGFLRSFPIEAEQCAVGGCYQLFEIDWDPVMTMPNFVSPLIPTVGYENINIIYLMAQGAFILSEPTEPTEDARCGTSYTIDGGSTFETIDSQISDINGEKSAIISASLEEATSNICTLQIRWEKQSLLNKKASFRNESLMHVCIIDEIKVCGTPITSDESNDESSDVSCDDKSDSTSDSMDNALFSVKNIDENTDIGHNDEMVISLSASMYINLFAMVGCILLAIIICLYIHQKNKNESDEYITQEQIPV